jgi:integrase
MPYTDEEMESIFTEAKKNARLNAMVFLLRYSGLRIGDAVTLQRNRIGNGRLLLYTAKSGQPVHLPLPPEALQALEVCPSRNAEYYFWTGEGGADTATNNWRDEITRLCRRAGVHGGRPHRFRDTLATSLLSKGVPVESVSAILGHSDIKITLKHYAPWVRARQEALDQAIMKTW